MNKRTKKRKESQVKYLLTIKAMGINMIDSLSYDSCDQLFEDLKTLFRAASYKGMEVYVKTVDNSINLTEVRFEDETDIVPFPEVDDEEI